MGIESWSLSQSEWKIMGIQTALLILMKICKLNGTKTLIVINLKWFKFNTFCIDEAA